MAFDIERALVAWVPGALGVPCVGDVPERLPDRFVTVDRTGGGSDLAVDRPTVALQCWAMSRADASDLAASMRDALIERLPAEVPQVVRVEVVGCYAFPDPEQRRPRYQVLASFVARRK